MELTNTNYIKVLSTSRQNSKDDKSHSILQSDTFTMAFEDGEYIMIKNAFKQNINVKKIPIQEEDDEDEDEDEEEGE